MLEDTHLPDIDTPPTPEPSPAEPPDATRSPAAPRWVERLMALIEVIVCSDYVTQVTLIALFTMIGFQPLDGAGRLSISYVATLLMTDTFLLLALVFFFLHVHGERPRDVFLGVRPPLRDVWFGLLVTPAILFFALVLLATIQAYLPALHNVIRNPIEELLRTPRDAMIFVVISIVAGGLREELPRAFILHRFEQHLGGAALGLVILSVAFGAGHVIQGWDTAIVTGTLGAIWGLVYLRRRSVVAPVVSHSAFDIAEIVHHTVFSV
ncbi:MAG: CPBP family intramembrane metalloprotease [Acidobacteria bacterium]|nr:CPBP family intramembrane metalloprotease [Acidobacteriota bacterium]